jgi:DNA invertase Pin-like site-specific DNA recombinase
MAEDSLSVSNPSLKRAALYARVSTKQHGQDPETQLLPLRDLCQARGLIIIDEYIDIGISGSKASRPQLDRLMNDAKKRRFDAVYVARFDRFARSVKHLVTALEEFHALGVDFISLNESIDTSTPMGKMVFTILGAVAELERSLIRERVQAGVDRARRQGKCLGRPKRVVDRERVLKLYAEHRSLRKVSQLAGVGKNKVASIVSSVNWVSQKPSIESPAN